MDERLKELYYSADDTGSYVVLSAFTGEQWKIKFPILPVMVFVNFYRGSEPTLSTNPQDATFLVTVPMLVVSTNNGRLT